MALEGSRIAKTSQQIENIQRSVLITNQIPPLPLAEADSEGNVTFTPVTPERRGQMVAYLDFSIETMEIYVAVDPNQDNTNFVWKKVALYGKAFNSDTGDEWDPLWVWYRNTTNQSDLG